MAGKGEEMEEMTKIWERLKLSEEENRPIGVECRLSEKLENKGKRSVVGKICSERKIGREVVRSTMEKIWRVGRSMEFQDIGFNRFIITFVSERDKEKVMGGCPWLFDHYLFVLKTYDGETQPNLMEFDKECFWIHMLNLPLSCMTRGMGEQIGGSVGIVKGVDVQEDGLAWGKVLRVRIECDLKKPLARGRTLEVEGKTMWIPFQYEKLPKLCYHCGRIVYEKEGCVEGTMSKQRISSGEMQYGSWLRAILGNRRWIERRWEQKDNEAKNEDSQGSFSDSKRNEGVVDDGRRVEEAIKRSAGGDEQEVETEVKGENNLLSKLVGMKEGVDFDSMSQGSKEEVQIKALSDSNLKLSVKGDNSVMAMEEVSVQKESSRGGRKGSWKRRARGRSNAGNMTTLNPKNKRSFESMEGVERDEGVEKKAKLKEVLLVEMETEGVQNERVVAAEQPHLAL